MPGTIICNSGRRRIRPITNAPDFLDRPMPNARQIRRSECRCLDLTSSTACRWRAGLRSFPYSIRIWETLRAGAQARDMGYERMCDDEVTPKGERPLCGARTRSGQPCRARAVWNRDLNRPANGRCRMHGGLSTGPKTSQGRRRSLEALRKGHDAWIKEQATLRKSLKRP